MDMPTRFSFSTRHKLILGWVLVIGLLGWSGFRMVRRLADKPYEDFQAFYLAAEAAQKGNDPYRAGTEMYIYLPMLAAWMAPLSRLTITQAAWVWFGLTLAATLGSLWLVWRALCSRLLWKPSPGDGILALGITLLIWQTQCRWEFEQGQTDWLTLFALSVGFYFLDFGSSRDKINGTSTLSSILNPMIVGLALGFAINIKYLPIVMVLYLAIRQRWACVGWSIIGTVLWGIAPALVYGWDRNLIFLGEGLGGLAKLVGIEIPGQAGYVFPLTYDRSITIPSVWGRVAEASGLGMMFTARDDCTLSGAGIHYRLDSFIVLIKPGFFVDRGGLAEQQTEVRGWVTFEWSFMLVLMIVFSPQSQMRHFFLLLPLVLSTAGLMICGSTLQIRCLALAGLIIGIVGSIGADIFTLFGARETWKYISGMSVCVLLLGYLTLMAGFQEMKLRYAAPRVELDEGDEATTIQLAA